MAVLLLLGVMVALFAFTLGVHLGKHTGGKTAVGTDPETHPALTQADKVPENPEIAQAGQENTKKVEEGLNQALHQEVEKSGLMLDEPRQVELPSEPKSKTAGATSPEPTDAKPDAIQDALKRAAQELTPEPSANASGKYTLQVGSHPSLGEAQTQMTNLEALGLQPYLRSVELKGKGVWHRIFIGGYSSKEEADKAGRQYKATKRISSFIVANRPE